MTRLPSNLRPTTHECVHLLTRGRFRSCDKDGSHTIRSLIAKNPMQHANLMALCFIELELWPLKVLHCGNSNFQPFCSCALDLEPMTFIHELDPYSLEVYQVCKFELSTSRLTKVIFSQIYIRTDRLTNMAKFIYHAALQVVSNDISNNNSLFKRQAVSCMFLFVLVCCAYTSASIWKYLDIGR